MTQAAQTQMNKTKYNICAAFVSINYNTYYNI